MLTEHLIHAAPVEQDFPAILALPAPPVEPDQAPEIPPGAGIFARRDAFARAEVLRVLREESPLIQAEIRSRANAGPTKILSNLEDLAASGEIELAELQGARIYSLPGVRRAQAADVGGSEIAEMIVTGPPRTASWRTAWFLDEIWHSRPEELPAILASALERGVKNRRQTLDGIVEAITGETPHRLIRSQPSERRDEKPAASRQVPDYLPTLEEIKAETEAIQATWTIEERDRRRWAFPTMCDAFRAVPRLRPGILGDVWGDGLHKLH